MPISNLARINPVKPLRVSAKSIFPANIHLPVEIWGIIFKNLIVEDNSMQTVVYFTNASAACVAFKNIINTTPKFKEILDRELDKELKSKFSKPKKRLSDSTNLLNFFS